MGQFCVDKVHTTELGDFVVPVELLGMEDDRAGTTTGVAARSGRLTGGDSVNLGVFNDDIVRLEVVHTDVAIVGNVSVLEGDARRSVEEGTHTIAAVNLEVLDNRTDFGVPAGRVRAEPDKVGSVGNVVLEDAEIGGFGNQRGVLVVRVPTDCLVSLQEVPVLLRPGDDVADATHFDSIQCTDGEKRKATATAMATPRNNRTMVRSGSTNSRGKAGG